MYCAVRLLVASSLRRLCSSLTLRRQRVFVRVLGTGRVSRPVAVAQDPSHLPMCRSRATNWLEARAGRSGGVYALGRDEKLHGA